jgi:tRNA A37 threonylcarbamoyladenosine synthetase subunit TsaC/SUA5/YrdC
LDYVWFSNITLELLLGVFMTQVATPPSDRFDVSLIPGEKIARWVADKQLGMSQAVKFADILAKGDTAVVMPTQVGYIIPATGQAGLDKMFILKGRPKTKAGVVLLPNVARLRDLAQVSPEIMRLYAHAEQDNTLLGCILPHSAGLKDLVPSGCLEMMGDGRGTSCFVTRYGLPSEQVVQTLWSKYRKLCFASSANPSGKGNRGELAYVGEQILMGADAILEGDFYVKSCQPQATAETRAEQGVMVSFVDDLGNLIDTKIAKPRIIRHGHQLEKVKVLLTEHFGGYEDVHGEHQRVYSHKK